LEELEVFLRQENVGMLKLQEYELIHILLGQYAFLEEHLQVVVFELLLLFRHQVDLHRCRPK
jgi:hypothetical protein